jgi:hypothetical protein
MTRDNSLRRADRVSGGARARGRLKIGDDWNAITIIALSQSNPMKAVAELIENSIDAKAHSVTVTRGREELAMTSAGSDRRPYQMMMRRGDPSYTVQPKRSLIPDAGTELRISPLLEGMRATCRERRSSGT